MTGTYNGFTNYETWHFDTWALNGCEDDTELILHQAKTLHEEEFAGWLMYNTESIMGHGYDERYAHTIDYKSLVKRYQEMVEEEDYFKELEEERKADNREEVKGFVHEAKKCLDAAETLLYSDDKDKEGLMRSLQDVISEAMHEVKNAIFIVDGGDY